MPKPLVILTFDQWKEAATEAFPIMQARSLVGTYYITPSMINTASGPSLRTLTLMKDLGWEIGVYTGANMANMEVNDSNATLAYLRKLKKDMWGAGFPADTLAAGQRAWSSKLSNLIDGMFSCARVADIYRDTSGHWLELPFAEDPHYVRNGGTFSLGENDTATGLSIRVDDLIDKGGAWIVVIHRVSDDGMYPSYTVGKLAFTGFMDKLALEVANKNINVVTFKDLCHGTASYR